MIETFQNALLSACLAGLGLVALAVFALFGGRILGLLRRSVPPRVLFALLGVAVVCTWAAQKRGTVTFPRTDPLVSYLTNTGSYTTNDFVHLSFTRIIVPDTAQWYLDRRQLSQTNDEDWVTFSTGTFAEWSPPIDIPCVSATNYNWMFYTDWTPGPSVQTNGVWHTYWGKDKRRREFFIPVRTCVRDGAEVIATPKSKEDNQ